MDKQDMAMEWDEVRERLERAREAMAVALRDDPDFKALAAFQAGEQSAPQQPHGEVSGRDPRDRSHVEGEPNHARRDRLRARLAQSSTYRRFKVLDEALASLSRIDRAAAKDAAVAMAAAAAAIEPKRDPQPALSATPSPSPAPSVEAASTMSSTPLPVDGSASSHAMPQPSAAIPLTAFFSAGSAGTDPADATAKMSATAADETLGAAVSTGLEPGPEFNAGPELEPHLSSGTTAQTSPTPKTDLLATLPYESDGAWSRSQPATSQNVPEMPAAAKLADAPAVTTMPLVEARTPQMRRQPSGATETQGPSAAPTLPADDLTRITWISTSDVARLAELGIHRYEQIAALSPRDMTLLGEVGLRDLAQREGWIEQAAILAEGKLTLFARARLAGFNGVRETHGQRHTAVLGEEAVQSALPPLPEAYPVAAGNAPDDVAAIVAPDALLNDVEGLPSDEPQPEAIAEDQAAVQVAASGGVAAAAMAVADLETDAAPVDVVNIDVPETPLVSVCAILRDLQPVDELSEGFETAVEPSPAPARQAGAAAQSDARPFPFDAKEPNDQPLTDDLGNPTTETTVPAGHDEAALQVRETPEAASSQSMEQRPKPMFRPVEPKDIGFAAALRGEVGEASVTIVRTNGGGGAGNERKVELLPSGMSKHEDRAALAAEQAAKQGGSLMRRIVRALTPG